MSRITSSFRSAFTMYAFSALALAPVIAQTQKPIPIYSPGSGKANIVLPNHPGSAGKLARPAVVQNGSSCTLLTFEGLGDLAAIPTFQGISLPDWLSIIENGAGGSGNFAGEPSPVTIAFWLFGNPTTQTIQIPNGASSVSLYYSSYYTITISAYDSNGTLLKKVTGAPNFDSGTGVYDIWSPLSLSVQTGKKIASLTVDGYANYTGIDDLNVCQSTGIHSVEITQAIQQYQTIDDLQASLKANGEPPVPIVSSKPAAMRLYFDQVQDVTDVSVHLSGVTDQTKSLAVQPNCTDENQRGLQNGCQSMDFYFTPPAGGWQATLDVVDGSGNVLSEQVLNVTSRDTNSLKLRAVKVCDSKTGAGIWNCQDPSVLLGNIGVLGKIAPTSSVTADVTNDVVRQDFSTFADEGSWFVQVASDVNANYGLWDSFVDFFAGRYTTYFGQTGPNVPMGGAGGIGGIAHGIPSHGAASRVSAIRLGVETNYEVVAHETGHTLGLKHTNTGAPAAGGAPPGCYSTAVDPSTNWPFANNNIQSAARLEYGFDVAAPVGQKVKDPNSTFDVMSYCVPRWVSPLRYKSMITTLGGGAVSSPSLRQGAKQPEQSASLQSTPISSLSRPSISAAPANFWQVRGTIQSGVVRFEPLFQLAIQNGNTTTGAGKYSLVEASSSGTAIFTRLFTPESPSTETAGHDVQGPPSFSQVIPVNAGVAALIVKDANGAEIGRITLGGTAPTVTITAPGQGFIGTGTKTVSWTAHGAGGATLTSKVLYSKDAGTTWSGLGDVPTGTTLPVDFSTLPGTTKALIRVLVSDGINTGVATSGDFLVPKKQPSTVKIVTPVTNSAQPAADPVYLSGYAFDIDDGALSSSALKWSSDIQGQLGSGAPLSVKLQPGTHTITLKATDSDGNTLSAASKVTVGGQAPTVVLQTQALDQAPTSCESATITVQPGQSGGAPLSLVQYSVNGGHTYQTIPLSNLPYKFIVPGSGFLHVVARAYDTSGQYDAKDATFLTQSVCKTGEPLIQGAVTSKGLLSPGVYRVTVNFTNVGAGLAQGVSMSVSSKRLGGSGSVAYQGTNPVTVPNLSPGQSASVQLSFSVPNPNTVTRFSIIESGKLLNAFNSGETFSISQQVIP